MGCIHKWYIYIQFRVPKYMRECLYHVVTFHNASCLGLGLFSVQASLCRNNKCEQAPVPNSNTYYYLLTKP